MSEKIYACLLWLYPSHFREEYGEEALQLFRDRLLDEKGFFSHLRLWMELLADLAVSVPKEYGYARPALVSVKRLNGAPTFYFVEDGLPSFRDLLLRSALALLASMTFSILLSHTGAKITTIVLASGPSQNSQLAQQQAVQAQPQEVVSVPQRTGSNLNAAERQRVVDAAAAMLRKYYVDTENGEKMANALQAHAKNGDYDPVTDGAAFAALLTQHMRAVNPDLHLTLDHFQESLGQHPAGPTAEGLTRYREAMKQQNCTFETVKILPHNIGYLKLNSFPEVSVCQATAAAAMASLNHADAIIFDLRDNRGGEPAMVALMAGYLFDHPEYLYNPRENTTEKSWTNSPVPGNKLAYKPVYVLTSSRTFSGAEQFSYDLKMLKRATLVGETTSGGAHSAVFHRIDDHFGMGIPETKAINPFSKTDWAEVGVEPDVKVKAADALRTAVRLAHNKLGRR